MRQKPGTKKGGRHPSPDPLSEVVRFRLTVGQRARLIEVAERHGQGITDFSRGLILREVERQSP